MLTHLFFAIAIHVMNGQLDSFTLTTTTDAVAGTTATITATLYHDFGIYECILLPTSAGVMYECSTSTCCSFLQAFCDPASEGKLILHTSNLDNLLIESLTLKSLTLPPVSITAWCIPTTQYNADTCTQSFWGADDTTKCGNNDPTTRHVSGIALANNLPACAVPAQIQTSFESTDTDEGSWIDLTGETVVLNPTCSPTINTFAPTGTTNMPTISTDNPSAAPTISTDNPSAAPTTSSDSDSESGSDSDSESNNEAAAAKDLFNNELIDNNDTINVINLGFSDGTLMNLWILFGIFIIANIIVCFVCKNKKRSVDNRDV